PTQVAADSEALAGLNELLEEWYYKPDLQAVRIVLGTIAAHYLNIGDPAWLFIVAPPGAGKTTMSLMGAAGLPQVIPIGDVTENTFLSGFYGHDAPDYWRSSARSGLKATPRPRSAMLCFSLRTSRPSFPCAEKSVRPF